MNRRVRLIVIVSALMAYSTAAIAQSLRSGSVTNTDAPARIAHPEVPRMPAAELAQLIKTKADIVIVDTQPSDGYQMWHIPSAVNIPYVSTANPMDRQLMLIALPMNKVIVVYCLCEEGTDSARMALELRDLGYDYDKIKVLEGGLIKWDEKGYPMIKTEVPE